MLHYICNVLHIFYLIRIDYDMKPEDAAQYMTLFLHSLFVALLLCVLCYIIKWNSVNVRMNPQNKSCDKRIQSSTGRTRDWIIRSGRLSNVPQMSLS